MTCEINKKLFYINNKVKCMICFLACAEPCALKFIHGCGKKQSWCDGDDVKVFICWVKKGLVIFSINILQQQQLEAKKIVSSKTFHLAVYTLYLASSTQ